MVKKLYYIVIKLPKMKKNRLVLTNHSSLVGKMVYYSRKVYSEHKVLKWDPDKAEFLLELDGQRFWSKILVKSIHY